MNDFFNPAAQKGDTSRLATPHLDGVVRRFLTWINSRGITVAKTERTGEELIITTPTTTAAFRLMDLSSNEGDHRYWGGDKLSGDIWEMTIAGTWYRCTPRQITIGAPETDQEREARRVKQLQRTRK